MHIGTPLNKSAGLGFHVIIDEYPNLTGTACMVMQIYVHPLFTQSFVCFFLNVLQFFEDFIRRTMGNRLFLLHLQPFRG